MYYENDISRKVGNKYFKNKNRIGTGPKTQIQLKSTYQLLLVLKRKHKTKQD